MQSLSPKKQAEEQQPKGKEHRSMDIESQLLTAPQLQFVNSKIRQYINELQREYLDRHNILLANRRRYQEIIESLAIQLDQKGITNQMIAEIFQNCAYHEGLE